MKKFFATFAAAVLLVGCGQGGMGDASDSEVGTDYGADTTVDTGASVDTSTTDTGVTNTNVNTLPDAGAAAPAEEGSNLDNPTDNQDNLNQNSSQNEPQAPQPQ